MKAFGVGGGVVTGRGGGEKATARQTEGFNNQNFQAEDGLRALTSTVCAPVAPQLPDPSGTERGRPSGGQTAMATGITR